MGKWYIDRSRNVSSIVSSIHYDLLKRLLNEQKKFIEPNELIDEMQIDGANKNALLTNFRDLGLIDENNKPSSFFRACTEADLPVSITVLLILLKRNDEKKEKNSLKPFVVISKALADMISNDCVPELTWGICDNYLMTLTSYDEINWVNLHKIIKANTRVLTTPVLDIWFNALIATELFDGDKKQIKLKREYYDFIKFVAKYGDEMLPSQSREEYLAQACDAQYGWYSLFSAHSYEAVCASKNLPKLISYVQTVDLLLHKESRVYLERGEAEYDSLSKEQLEDELQYLSKQELEIKEKINRLKERLSILKENEKFLNIKTNVENENLFSFYLQNNKELSDHTIASYFQSLRKMKDILFQYEKIVINTEIYFIDDVTILEQIIARFEGNKDLRAINKAWHNAISAAYNNYCEFLNTMKEIG